MKLFLLLCFAHLSLGDIRYCQEISKFVKMGEEVKLIDPPADLNFKFNETFNE